MQLLKNGIGSGSPAEGLAVGVVVGDELVNAADELLDAGERAAPYGLVGNQREEAFDLIQPGTVGWHEVHVPARAACQPGLDLRMAVRGVVVDDAMNVQLSRHGLVDLAQERQEFLMAMTRLASGQYRAVEHIQGREQRGRAVAFVVVRDAFDVAQAHGQHRLRALQRLALTLLIHAQHQCVLGRAQIQAHHVAQLLHEERVVGQLEALGAMRLQAKELEVALHAALGDASLGSHRSHAPVRRAVGRLGVQRCLDQAGHALVIDAARRAGTHVVVKPRNAALDETSAPLAHCGLGQLQALSDRTVGFAVSAAQDDVRSRAQRRRQRAAARERHELRLLIVRHHQLRLRPASVHRSISSSKIPQRHALFMPFICGTAH